MKRYGNLMRIWFRLVILSCTILLLPACGGVSTKSEAAIRAEFPAEYCVITVNGEEINLGIEEFTVDRRRANEETETETVYCTAVLQNNEYELIARFGMEYVYYEKGGWILDDVWYSNTEESMLQVRNGLPEQIADKYLNGFSSFTREHTYNVGAYDAYNAYQVTGSAEVLNDDTVPPLEYSGSVLLHGRLEQREWNEYVWDVSIAEQQLTPTEEIPVEMAQLFAQRYYPSAQIQAENFDKEVGVHQYTFSVNEEHLYCDSVGTMELDYRFNYFDVEEDAYITPKWEVFLDRSNVETDWKIEGTWSGEFFHASDIGSHYDWYCPISFTIADVTSEAIVFLGGTCEVTNTYALEDGELPYEILEDGTLQFEIESGGGYTFRISVSPDQISAMFPWLSYSKTDLVREE